MLVGKWQGGLMKTAADKKRVREIAAIYRKMGIGSAKVRKYLINLGCLPVYSEQHQQPVYFDSGNDSIGRLGGENAGLEPDRR
jgi:hypothetical protein